MMTFEMVMALVDEYYEEEKKTVRVPHYYKRNGEIKRRSYDDLVETPRYKELSKLLRSEEAKIFKCAYCGEMCSWFELESWICDFDKGQYACSLCYEESMGDDL